MALENKILQCDSGTISLTEETAKRTPVAPGKWGRGDPCMQHDNTMVFL